MVIPGLVYKAKMREYNLIVVTHCHFFREAEIRLKDVFSIFKNDVKSVSRQFFALAIMVAICILPALYAWVNIYANGNPYVNTGNIKIALASNDPGVVLDDGQRVNMTQEVFDELKDSTSIGWQFPDTPEEAIAGVESGKYYAAIVFEDNFTYNMYHFEQALLDDREPLTFYENAKKNAVASKITETAASTLQENINKKYLETVFSVVFDETKELSDDLESGDTADAALQQLRQTQATLDSYDKAIGSFMSNSDRVQSSISSARSDLADTRAKNRESLAKAQQDLARAEKTIESLNSTVDDRLDSLDDRLDTLEQKLQDIKGKNPVTPEEQQAIKDGVSELLADMEQLRSLLPDDSSLPSTETVKGTLDSMIETVKGLQGLDDVPGKAEEILTAVDTLRSLEKTSLRPGFRSMIDSMSKTVSMLGPFVGNISDMLDGVDPVLSATSTTVDSMDDTLGQLRKVFRSASDRIGEIIEEVENASEDDRVALLIDLLGGDSELYGRFFSSLVDVEIKEVYTAASYGAAMAPFYSVLAIWVGGVILVSILRTHADRKIFPGLREGQYFFGRWILFFLTGQIQAAVIVAGDIFLLHCQPVHPVLMFLAAAVTSLVFVTFIYALTLSFGDIGKAIVVVVMVVQIAGSSGSYPIEILPEIFSKIYKFFPFPYAINAMREALCGVYRFDMLIYLAELMLFGVLALVIGLVIRRPFIGMNRFVAEKLEETEVL